MLVRGGKDQPLPERGNDFCRVYGAMLLQVCRDYNGIPDARTLQAHEILFFYDGLRPELRTHTSPRG